MLSTTFGDCRCLWGEGDLVCGATQVLPEHRHCRRGGLFWPARTIGRRVIVA
ncbi:MAG: hypothetical protein GDA36_13305 [Rhodobacteraceae bacterium]|nr:hypothetical protein [Paracoccaceae bacterium]